MLGGIKLLFYVHCAIFIGINGYGISNHLKSSDDDENIEGNQLHSVEIVGGNEVDITQYPYQVGLIYSPEHPTIACCGGSIISEQFVLTAAHCVVEKVPTGFKIRVGSKYNYQGGTIYDISSVTVNPNYDKLCYSDYDAALLRTSEPIKINGQTTKIVQLASSDNLDPGTPMTVSGWGRTKKYGGLSKVLKAVSLPLVDRVRCNEMWNKYHYNITDRMLCAGYNEERNSACKGDSGGPLVAENNLIQYGIVSFTRFNCSSSLPNVYTNVAAIRDWIKQVSGV